MIIYALFFICIMICWAFVVTEGIRAIFKKLFGKKPPVADEFTDF